MIETGHLGWLNLYMCRGHILISCIQCIYTAILVYIYAVKYLNFSGGHRPPGGSLWRHHLTWGCIWWLLRFKHHPINRLLGRGGGTETPYRDTIWFQICNYR